MTTNEPQYCTGGSQCHDLHEHAIEHARERSLLTKKLRRKQTDMRLKALTELDVQVAKQQVASQQAASQQAAKQFSAPTPVG